MFSKGKIYSIIKEEQKKSNLQPIPRFIVEINMSTINKEFSALADKLKKNPVIGILFNIEESSKLVVSILPTPTLDTVADKQFREILSLATNYQLSSNDSTEILKEYDRFLGQYNLKSPMSSNSQKSISYARPGGSAVF